MIFACEWNWLTGYLPWWASILSGLAMGGMFVAGYLFGRSR